MSEPIATVIIPNYKGMRYLPHLLASLARQSDPRLSVLIVDDQSPDDSAAYVRSNWPDVRLIVNERNLGFAGTCNVGLRSAQTPFVALLNNDTHVDEHWLTEAIRAFDADDIGSVASLVVLAEPPHLIDTAGDVYSVVGGAVKRNHLQPRQTALALPDTCFSPSGASAFYRREAVERAGLFDETFESYYEDVDLGFRLAWAGYRCRFAAKSICYHHLSSSYSPRGRTYHFNSARNAEFVWQANMPPALKQRYAAARRMFLALQGANKLRQGCFRAWRAGRKAARRLRQRMEARQAALPLNDPVVVERIVNRLEHDWWALHVSSRFDRSANMERSR